MFDIQTFCLVSAFFFSPQNEETACNHHNALATFQGRAHSSLQPAVEDKQVNKRRLFQAGFQRQNLLFNQHEKLAKLGSRIRISPQTNQCRFQSSKSLFLLLGPLFSKQPSATAAPDTKTKRLSCSIERDWCENSLNLQQKQTKKLVICIYFTGDTERIAEK